MNFKEKPNKNLTNCLRTMEYLDMNHKYIYFQKITFESHQYRCMGGWYHCSYSGMVFCSHQAVPLMPFFILTCGIFISIILWNCTLQADPGYMQKNVTYASMLEGLDLGKKLWHTNWTHTYHTHIGTCRLHYHTTKKVSTVPSDISFLVYLVKFIVIFFMLCDFFICKH